MGRSDQTLGTQPRSGADCGHPEKGTISMKSEADPKPLMAVGSYMGQCVSLGREICVTTVYTLGRTGSLSGTWGLLQGSSSLSSWGYLDERGRWMCPHWSRGLSWCSAPLVSTLHSPVHTLLVVTSAGLRGLRQGVTLILIPEDLNPSFCSLSGWGPCSVHSR